MEIEKLKVVEFHTTNGHSIQDIVGDSLSIEEAKPMQVPWYKQSFEEQNAEIKKLMEKHK